FVVHTGSRTFIGASPERHVSLSDGTLVMNPISGTYRYPAEGPTLAGVLDFLADAKETNELYMVVDEELKMMANVCQSGIRVVGPYLKEMGRLAHTEYFLHGRSALDVRTILRETMFAPTVTGSPLENACRVIARQEPNSRGYYSGVIALIGRDGKGARTLDSAILIRTADVGAQGGLRIGVGATVVRNSDPSTEAQETRAKAAALVSALDSATVTAHSPSPGAALGRHPEVAGALERRNMTLSGLWLGSPAGHAPPPGLVGRRILVVDAEDRFTAMLDWQLRALGLAVTVQPYHRPVNVADTDMVLVGPGPGDPREHANPKIDALRQITLAMIQAGVPLVSVCLGHQVLAGLLGFELVRKQAPNQGVQREIDLFGRGERVGFYNSFAARSEHDLVHCLGLPRPIEVSRDFESGEVHALRGPRFVSMQFHPESVLTQNGLTVVGELISSMLERAEALAPSLSTF
ncbi:MAG TPA: anthranilate synthase family protein, partial [Pseudonocardiaceae bacterium]|nr:anthranilate synthase family protein [Pseudonocardiaceae bacterium]